MKVLITGATGFIGSYLAQFLAQQGMNVVLGCRDKSKLHNTAFADYETVAFDVLSDLSFSFEADALVHVATPNDIVSKKTGDGIHLATAGTRNALDFCVRNKIPNFIFFSTLQVYGTELAGTITEGSPALAENDYGMNHLFGEMYVEMYARQGKINGVSVRPSNVHGPFMLPSINRWTLVPGCFCKEIVSSQTITIKSSGKQMRNFVHLQNLSNAVKCILENMKPGYDVVNTCSTEALSMLDVAIKVKAIYEARYGKEAKVIVEGTNPPASNIFNVPLDKLTGSYSFSEDKSYNIDKTINSLFTFLETTKQQQI